MRAGPDLPFRPGNPSEAANRRRFRPELELREDCVAEPARIGAGTAAPVQNEHVQRLLSVRITRTGWKAVYLLAYLVLGQLAYRLIPASVVTTVVIDIVQLFGIWYATRVFRARGEPVAPARLWWRATAWETASWRLGVLFLLGFLINPISQVVVVLGLGSDRFTALTPFELIDSMLYFGLLAAFYLNSWVRLRAVPTPLKPARERAVLRRPTSKLN